MNRPGLIVIVVLVVALVLTALSSMFVVASNVASR